MGEKGEFKDGTEVGSHRKRIPSSETETQRRRDGVGSTEGEVSWGSRRQ